MAILVMFSTVSVTVEKHYCKDHLVDVAIFGKAKKCGPEGEMPTKKTPVKSCCDDVLEVYQGQDQLHKADYQFQIENLVFVPNSPIFAAGIIYISGFSKIHLPQHYIPPNPEVNLLVLHQTFLI
jgi:hypothetical protein